jgi:hypothetical protein
MRTRDRDRTPHHARTGRPRFRKTPAEGDRHEPWRRGFRVRPCGLLPPPEYAVTDGTVVPVTGSNGNGWNTLGDYTVMLRAA